MVAETEKYEDKITKSWIEVFMSKIKIIDSCWVWQGSIISNGYGQFYSHLDTTFAHVFSYSIFCGELLDNLEIDHSCNNRACVSPKHLEQITHSENVKRSYYNRHNNTYNYDEFNGKTGLGRIPTSIENSEYITQEELIDNLKDKGLDVDIRTLRFWRYEGIIPQMERKGLQWYYPISIINFLEIVCISKGREYNGIIIEEEIEGERFKVYEINITKDKGNKDFVIQKITNKGLLIERRDNLDVIY